MPDHKPKPDRPTPHKDHLCKTCRRPIRWQKKYEQDWDIIKFCSDSCSGYLPGEKDATLEAAILQLLHEAGPNQTIDSSEAAKAIAASTQSPREKSTRRDWESLLQPARAAARRLAAQNKIIITQHNRIVDPTTAKGPIRLKLR